MQANATAPFGAEILQAFHSACLHASAYAMRRESICFWNFVFDVFFVPGILQIAAFGAFERLPIPKITTLAALERR